MDTKLPGLRRQLGDAIWEVRLAEARECESIVGAVMAAVDVGSTFAAAAREHAPHVGIATVSRWVARWRAEGLAGLIDQRAGVSKSGVEAPAPQLSFGFGVPEPQGSCSPPRRAPQGRRARLVKWSGSKHAVVDKLVAMAPVRFERYHEPFLGGGSLFFALRPRASVLSDLNAELVNLYLVVRDQPADLLAALGCHQNTRERFLKVRGIHPDALPPVERAARTLFLNRTCFNGLYRVNKRGIFNVPYGDAPHQSFYVPDAIWRAHRDLVGSEVSCASFERCAERSRPGDFIYLDPPYPRGLRGDVFDPVAYQAGGFGETDHRRVAELVRLLDQRGCLVMVSNADCRLTRELFAGLRIDSLAVQRQVGGHVERRGVAREIVVRNYSDDRSPLSLFV